jgi:hypothetical protein
MDVTQTTPAPWIKLSETTGRFTPSDRHFEDRIRVSIDWNVYALDPGVILDRFEIAFTGAPRAYGPVPETRVLKPD